MDFEVRIYYFFMLKLVTAPNEILTKLSQPVTNFDNNLQKLINQMEETLIAQHDPPGVGLAAPQIGISQAIFIMKPNENAKTEIFINPKILEIKNPKSPHSGVNKLATKKRKSPLEGCLSVPRIWGPVKRNKQILLEYQDLNGNKFNQWFKGFKAIIIQHEMDHLNGVLFTQRALEQKSPLYEETDGDLKRLDTA